MATAKKKAPAAKKPAQKKATLATKPSEKSPAARLVAGLPEKQRPFAETLAETAYAMKAKLEQQLPEYESAALTQTVTSTQGEKVIKQNPFVAEFRATARDYAFVVRELQATLADHGDSDKIADLVDFKNRYNIV